MNIFPLFSKKKFPQFAEYSDIGKQETNQDSMAHFITKDWFLLVVADGLGGHEAGEIAAQLITKTIIKQTKKYQKELYNNPEEAYKTILNKAVTMVTAKLAKQKLKAHTTVASLFLDLKQSRFMSAHIGDSRIYHFKNHHILWRSRDHSVIQMLLDDNEITEAEMGQHPEQGILTRSISAKKKALICFSDFKPLKKGEGLLLCTDGYWENLPVNQVSCFISIKKGDLSKKLIQCIQQAKQNDENKCDNITVQVILV